MIIRTALGPIIGGYLVEHFDFPKACFGIVLLTIIIVSTLHYGFGFGYLMKFWILSQVLKNFSLFISVVDYNLHHVIP